MLVTKPRIIPITISGILKTTQSVSKVFPSHSPIKNNNTPVAINNTMSLINFILVDFFEISVFFSSCSDSSSSFGKYNWCTSLFTFLKPRYKINKIGTITMLNSLFIKLKSKGNNIVIKTKYISTFIALFCNDL